MTDDKRNTAKHRIQSEPASSPPKSREQHGRATSSSPPQVSLMLQSRKRRLDEEQPPALLLPAQGPVCDRSSRTSVLPISGSEASEGDGSEGENAPTGDSPERPNIPRDDRFALKGKRKKAAQAMMPAIFFKKAQKDLELMREEKKTGSIRHTLEGDAGDGEDGVDRRANARVRLNPRNANKPIRFIADESTSESDKSEARAADSGSEEEDTQHALHAWASLAQAKKKSHDLPQEKQAGKAYWNNVIGNILVRDRLERQSGSQRLAVRKRTNTRKGRHRDEGTRDEHSTLAQSSRKSLHQHQPIGQSFVPAVPLDDVDSLFAAIPLRSDGQGVTPARRRPFVQARDITDSGFKEDPTIDVPAPASSKAGKAVNNSVVSDRWTEAGSSFSRFSCDFNLQPLPAGTSFSAATYLGRGYLQELLGSNDSPIGNENVIFGETPFGIHLDSEMEPEVFLSMLPRLCDSIYVECTSEAPPSSLLASSTGQALHFTARYTYGHPAKPDTACVERVLAGLEDLEARLDRWLAQQTARRSAEALLVARWYMVEFGYRACLSSDWTTAEVIRQLQDRLVDLVHAALSTGLNKPMKALDSIGNASDVRRSVDDLHCELWVCILHVASATIGSTKVLSEDKLWNTVDTHLEQLAESRSLHPILAGEISSYTAMALARLSQFTADGTSQQHAQLGSYWPIHSKVIDRLQPQEFAAGYACLSRIGRTRASRYVWTLYARCLVLATRWKWPLLDQSRLVGRLFDMLNARDLEDMSIDGLSQFPGFLADYAGTVGTEIERNDTVFCLLLRIIARVASEAEGDGSPKNLAIPARLAMRITPMREHLIYPSQPSTGAQRKHRSVLINHYSLHILLAAVDAKNADRRFDKFKATLDFPAADIRARQDCLRAITYLGIVYIARDIDIGRLVQWLAEIADHLRDGFVRVSRQRLAQVAELQRASTMPDGKRGNKSMAPGPAVGGVVLQKNLARCARQLGEIAITMGVLLGAIQQLIQAQRSHGVTRYPPIAMLHSGACPIRRYSRVN